MRETHPATAILTAALLLAPAAPGSAQTFSEDVSVLEVEVPVQVLVDGRSVRGLTRENFELLVDGELQELSWFQALELGETLTGPVATDGGAAVRAEPTAGPSGWQRHYLLLFDFGFSSPYRIEHAVQGLRRMVETQSNASDRLALALFAEAVGARVLVPFTSDRQGIHLGLDFLESLADARPRRSIEKLEALDAWWRASDTHGSLPRPLLADMGSHATTLIQPLRNPPEPAGVGLPIAREGVSSAELSDRYRIARLDSILGLGGSSLSAVRALGRSMASLVTLLRDVPDPKHLFFLSQGLGGLFTGTETATPALHRLKPMVDAFGDSGWILQAIDIGGLPSPPSSVFIGPEDYDSTVELGLRTVTTAGSEGSGLFYLANETGGELFENYNRIHRATEKILARTQATYLLAFQPRQVAADGQRYEIEVRLNPPIANARLLHRPGFRAPRPPTERLLAERRMDAAETALGDRRITELGARVLPVVLPSASGARVPVLVEVETDRLDAGRKGKKRVRLDVHGYVLDQAGVVRAGFTRELRFRPAGEGVVALLEELEVPAGSHELRLLIWDLRGDRRHLSHSPLEVARADGAPGVSGPFFLVSDALRRHFSPKEIQPTDGLALFELGGEPGRLDLAPTIERDRSRRFLVLAPGWVDTERPALRIEVVAADGRAIRGVELERLEDGADGTARFAGVLETAGLPTGSFQLRATLEVGDGPSSVSAAPFVLAESSHSR